MFLFHNDNVNSTANYTLLYKSCELLASHQNSALAVYAYIFCSVYPQLLKCMVWRLGKNTIQLITYVGAGLCKNIGPISSHVYGIYFKSTNGDV